MTTPRTPMTPAVMGVRRVRGSEAGCVARTARPRWRGPDGGDPVPRPRPGRASTPPADFLSDRRDGPLRPRSHRAPGAFTSTTDIALTCGNGVNGGRTEGRPAGLTRPIAARNVFSCQHGRRRHGRPGGAREGDTGSRTGTRRTDWPDPLGERPWERKRRTLPARGCGPDRTERS